MKTMALRATLSASVVALISLLGLSSPLAAAGLLQRTTNAEAASATSRGPTLGALVLRSRVAKLDVNELAAHVAPLNMDSAADRVERANALDGIISIELFPGTTAIFQRQSIDESGDSGYAWVGRVKGSPFKYASLIVDNGEVTGHIQLMHRIFQIHPIGGGLHQVIELDSSKFPPDDPPQQRTVEPNKRGAIDGGDTRAASTVVNVLAAYTPAAATDAGGKTNIINQIKQAVSLANVGYANTGIPLTVKLVKVMASGAYTEQADIAEDLNRLDGVTPGFLAKVRNARESVKADLVSLFRRNDPQFCGIANLTDTPDAATTNNFAYHVMNWTCVSNLSFHHEMGHNMGLRHDYYVDPTPGIHYNHGYVNRTNACRIRTVMAYNNECVDKNGFNCTRINAFSTGKFVAGSCKIGTNKSGTLKRMDNTQRLKETRGTISHYR